MKDNLGELIQDARRTVRLASGIPLSPKEQAEERRLKEIKEMEMFVYEAFRFKLIMALKAKVIWTAKGAALEMQADEQVFYLRKDEDAYALFAIEDQGSSRPPTSRSDLNRERRQTGHATHCPR